MPKAGMSIGQICAGNVRYWRENRGLDQQQLADRVADLGWDADRTAIVRIENGKRRVNVDELGWLAAALNVPLPLMLLPVESGASVKLAKKRDLDAMNCWRFYEWMAGNEPLPGRLTLEWRTSASLLWIYDDVRAAQLAVAEASTRGGVDSQPFKEALTDLVNAVAAMTEIGLPVSGLVPNEYAKQVKAIRPMTIVEQTAKARAAARVNARRGS